ncbi:helix-turn-helix transcriptional regulator [Polaribacter haliotis]|uniref:Helix-turn-helix transcriptional regulator n=1 Tax=Polaribacter haliotis TaxID=1888915 RepID=A0A7L8ADP2_9FLAO|nr:helix-turn-helix transcriptional regulator [Polaribacter haliotis]QOD60047.1 helix-turn-helix transcriptional regulator [Polaribacter haliotis]
MEEAELKEFIKKIGNLIKKLRLERNMTQLDLAVASNIDERQIQRLEASHTSPTIKTLYKISKALDIELYLLLKFTD